MEYSLLTKARKALQGLWERAYLRGSCWGPKSKENPYSGTNILFAAGKELVSVSQRGDTLIVHEFQKTENTELGQRVREILRSIDKKPLIIKENEVIPMTDYMWCCWACDKKNGFDGADDPHITVRRPIEDHRRVSPDCHPTTSEFKIYRVHDGVIEEEKALLEILALELAK